MMAAAGAAEAEGSGRREDPLPPIPQIGFLGGLRPEVVEEIIESAPFVRYPAGTTTFESGPAVVVSGLLGYFLWFPGGRQITIRYIGVGDLVGRVALPDSTLTTAVQAIEPSVLLQIDQARLEAVAKRHSEVSFALVEELTRRLRGAYRALASRSFATVRSRVARDLIERATAAGRLDAGLRLRVTQQALADATGSVREVVARSLRELRRDGVVATDHTGVTILDLAGLARVAGLDATVERLPPR
jgi:CRP/FNR family cyclic AMP-dependent transcriptional regulator